MSNRHGWMDEETAAEELALPIEVVQEAVKRGLLPALVIKGHVRISRDAMIDIASQSVSSKREVLDVAIANANQVSNSKEESIPVPLGLNWKDELTKIGDFSHFWPQKREHYGNGNNKEDYTQAWAGSIILASTPISVKVGRASRKNRGRLTVFFDKSPVSESCETADGKHWASLVKPDGKKILSVGQIRPSLYQSARLESYREATGMTGIGVPRGLAVVIGIDDMRSSVHHAAARWLGKRSYPLVAAS